VESAIPPKDLREMLATFTQTRLFHHNQILAYFQGVLASRALSLSRGCASILWLHLPGPALNFCNNS